LPRELVADIAGHCHTAGSCQGDPRSTQSWFLKGSTGTSSSSRHVCGSAGGQHPGSNSCVGVDDQPAMATRPSAEGTGSLGAGAGDQARGSGSSSSDWREGAGRRRSAEQWTGVLFFFLDTSRLCGNGEPFAAGGAAVGGAQGRECSSVTAGTGSASSGAFLVMCAENKSRQDCYPVEPSTMTWSTVDDRVAGCVGPAAAARPGFIGFRGERGCRRARQLGRRRDHQLRPGRERRG